MNQQKIKIGVLGAGHLGKIHIKLLKNITTAELVGFFDANLAHAQQVSEELQVPFFETQQQLFEATQALDIVTPTPHHHTQALQALEQGKHLFIEKPITQTPQQALDILNAHQHKPHLKIQIGHVERFNPAFIAIKPLTLQPAFIEVHRLAQFNPRGTDVSVVLDLMIHDIDLVLSVVKQPITNIHANGVAIVSAQADIANARLEFQNGCVCNLTASRLSLNNMRKMRIFEPTAYISLDFLNKKTDIVRLHNQKPAENPNFFEIYPNPQQPDLTRYITLENPQTENINAIEMELKLFIDSILYNKATPVSAMEGYEALKIAYEINQKIETQHQLYAHNFIQTVV